jgi:hypothetical protein
MKSEAQFLRALYYEFTITATRLMLIYLWAAPKFSNWPVIAGTEI